MESINAVVLMPARPVPDNSRICRLRDTNTWVEFVHYYSRDTFLTSKIEE